MSKSLGELVTIQNKKLFEEKNTLKIIAIRFLMKYAKNIPTLLTRALQQIQKHFLVRGLPRPKPLKLDKPTIKFKKNKLTNRFEVFRVTKPVRTSKRRKKMEIEN